MALNLKNPEADRLAHEVATMTGESLTTAVIAALRERRDRLQAESDDDRDARFQRIDQLTKDMRARLSPSLLTGDPTAFLYGNDGLPQ